MKPILNTTYKEFKEQCVQDQVLYYDHLKKELGSISDRIGWAISHSTWESFDTLYKKELYLEEVIN